MGTYIFCQCPHIAWGCHAAQTWACGHTTWLHPFNSATEIVNLTKGLSVDLFTIAAVEGVRIRAPQGKLTGFAVLDTEILPVEQGAETFDTIALVDTLPTRLLGEGEHMFRELVDGILNRLHTSVDDIATFILRSFYQIVHETTKTRKVRGDGGYTHLREVNKQNFPSDLAKLRTTVHSAGV